MRKIEEYINMLSLAGKSFVVYQYNRNSEEQEIFRFDKEKVYEDRCCLNCKDCNSRKETDEEILKRVKNMGKSKVHKFGIFTLHTFLHYL